MPGAPAVPGLEERGVGAPVACDDPGGVPAGGLTLVTAHGRVGSPRARTLFHCRPALLVTWTTGRLRPATIHHTRASTTLAGHKAVK
jgi:hypothetical protein